MKLLTPSLLLLGIFVFGGLVFKLSAPTQCDEIRPHDSVFVLTGDIRRIPFAMRKTREYPNTNLYIIGVGTTYYTAPNITIESKSKSTYQNALAIKNITTEQNLNRIVIITTEEHMNRAQYLLKREMPNIQIITCPAPLHGMPVAKRVKRWTIEYIKYIVTLFGIKEG